jgi:hypothetical protein
VIGVGQYATGVEAAGGGIVKVEALPVEAGGAAGPDGAPVEAGGAAGAVVGFVHSAPLQTTVEV